MDLSKELKISLIQSDLHWEDIDSNISMFEQKIKAIDHSDIIVLPEMFTTGFSNNASNLAEEMGGRTSQWLKKMAAEKSSAICGSIIIKEEGHFYNRFLWMEPDKEIQFYNKRHLFAMAGENETYKAGEELKIINFKGWKINLQICYDLRFPVWSRRHQDQDYDLIIYVASWPVKRIKAWSTLLQARAIENQSYCVGLNRVGSDGNDIEYTGASVIIDPLGTEICSGNPGKEETLEGRINKTHLMKIREKLPFHKDQDSFSIL